MCDDKKIVIPFLFSVRNSSKKRIASEGQVLLSARQVSVVLGDATGSER